MSKSQSDKRSDSSTKPSEWTVTTGGDEILDWDAYIEAPPRPSGKIKVRLNFRGRGRPIPLEPPEDDTSGELS